MATTSIRLEPLPFLLYAVVTLLPTVWLPRSLHNIVHSKIRILFLSFCDSRYRKAAHHSRAHECARAGFAASAGGLFLVARGRRSSRAPLETSCFLLVVAAVVVAAA